MAMQGYVGQHWIMIRGSLPKKLGAVPAINAM